jgi:hypothetical protein
VTAPLALVCGGCGSDLAVDLHRPDCGALRTAYIGRPPWQILRLARDEGGRRLEDLLEQCNRRARAWLAVRGRPFPC